MPYIPIDPFRDELVKKAILFVAKKHVKGSSKLKWVNTEKTLLSDFNLVIRAKTIKQHSKVIEDGLRDREGELDRIDGNTLRAEIHATYPDSLAPGDITHTSPQKPSSSTDHDTASTQLLCHTLDRSLQSINLLLGKTLSQMQVSLATIAVSSSRLTNALISLAEPQEPSTSKKKVQRAITALASVMSDSEGKVLDEKSKIKDVQIKDDHVSEEDDSSGDSDEDDSDDDSEVESIPPPRPRRTHSTAKSSNSVQASAAATTVTPSTPPSSSSDSPSPSDKTPSPPPSTPSLASQKRALAFDTDSMPSDTESSSKAEKKEKGVKRKATTSKLKLAPKKAKSAKSS